jgi:cobalt-zinc-cadmium efflux system outer membrane protein
MNAMTPTSIRRRPPKNPIAYRFFSLIGFAISLSAVSAMAQQTALTEQESIRLGLARPDIEEVIAATQEVARSEAAGAGLWANPVLDFQRESVPSGSTRATERSYMVSQQFDVSGKRALRRSAAGERVAAATADADQRRLELGAEIRRRFYEALYRKELVAAALAWDGRMEVIGATIQKLHKGGEVAGYDRRRIALERAGTQARLRAEQAAYDKAWQRLVALIGNAPAKDALSGQLLPGDAAPLESLLSTLDQRPEIRALNRRAAAFGLDQKAAQRGWIPDVTVGIGSKSIDNGLAAERGTVVALSVPLPLFDRGQAAAGKAAAQAREAGAEARLQRSRLEGDLRGLWQQVRQLNAAARDYTAQSQQGAIDLARIAEASYQGGETGILELLDAYRAVHEAQARALELSWSARQGAIDLDTIAGNAHP